MISTNHIMPASSSAPDRDTPTRSRDSNEEFSRLMASPAADEAGTRPGDRSAHRGAQSAVSRHEESKEDSDDGSVANGNSLPPDGESLPGDEDMHEDVALLPGQQRVDTAEVSNGVDESNPVLAAAVRAGNMQDGEPLAGEAEPPEGAQLNALAAVDMQQLQANVISVREQTAPAVKSIELESRHNPALVSPRPGFISTWRQSGPIHLIKEAVPVYSTEPIDAPHDQLSADRLMQGGVASQRPLVSASGTITMATTAAAPITPAAITPAAIAIQGSGELQNTAASTTTAATPLHVATAVGAPGWTQQLHGQIHWAANKGIQLAELSLHPADLGKLEIEIVSEGGRTDIIFFSANKSAREAIEAELPRLRDLFSQSGLELGHSETSEQSLADRKQSRELELSWNESAPGVDDSQDDSLDGTTSGRGRVELSPNLIDHYV